MEKYLYFRTAASTDDGADDSACYPLSSFVGATVGQDDNTADDQIVTLFFKSLRNNGGEGCADGGFGIHDTIEIKSVASNSKAKEVMEDLIAQFTNSKDNMLVVCDDLDDIQCSSLIASVEVITVQAALS